MPTSDLVGQRFHHLLVIQFHGVVNGRSLWHCQCDCGKKRLVEGYVLRKGITKGCGSCGKISHGLTKTTEYMSWRTAKARCYNPKTQGYACYGGRGIKMCAQWRDSFEVFLSDMGPKPAGTTLDRKNVDGDYEPGNCQWADALEQGRHKRTNVRIAYKGETKTASDWARSFDLKLTTFLYRFSKLKWPMEVIERTPLHARI